MAVKILQLIAVKNQHCYVLIVVSHISFVNRFRRKISWPSSTNFAILISLMKNFSTV